VVVLTWAVPLHVLVFFHGQQRDLSDRGVTEESAVEFLLEKFEANGGKVDDGLQPSWVRNIWMTLVQTLKGQEEEEEKGLWSWLLLTVDKKGGLVDHTPEEDFLLFTKLAK